MSVQYEDLGDRAVSDSHSIGLSCHHCRVTWRGCAAECCCPRCGAEKGFHPDDAGRCYCEQCRQTLTEHATRLDCQPYYAAYVIETGAQDADAAWERDGSNVAYIAWISERWRELHAQLGTPVYTPVSGDLMIKHLESRLWTK